MTTREIEDLVGIKLRKSTEFLIWGDRVFHLDAPGDWIEYPNYVKEANRCSDDSENTPSG